MRLRTLLSLILVITLCKISWCQSKNESHSDYVKTEQVYLVNNRQKTNLFDLKKTKIITLLGKPKSVKKQMSETDGRCTNYFYPNGEISYDEQNHFNSIAIKKAGWGLSMVSTGKAARTFSVGENISILKSYFPNSWKDYKGKMLFVHLKSKSGEIDPYTWIVFYVDHNIIKSISYAFNNF
jgi:hypothetical protein